MKCDACGKKTLINYGDSQKNLCSKCSDMADVNPSKVDVEPENNSSNSTSVKADHSHTEEDQSPPWMGIAGVLLLLAGLYFLVLDPGSPASAEIINLQKISIGQTLSIVGAIFIGFQWRPRD